MALLSGERASPGVVSMRYEFRLLGPVEVRRDGEPVDAGTPKQRRLLVALLLHPNAVVPVHSLVEAVWDTNPPASAVANVRTYAARLRSRLADPDLTAGSRLRQRRPGYLLAVDPGECDLTEFDSLVAAARADADRRATAAADATFTRALGLWRGVCAAEVERDGVLGVLLAAADERYGGPRRTHGRTPEAWPPFRVGTRSGPAHYDVPAAGTVVGSTDAGAIPGRRRSRRADHVRGCASGSGRTARNRTRRGTWHRSEPDEYLETDSIN